MPDIEAVLLWAISQTGKPYVLGAEWTPGEPPPEAEDCSELVQNACDDAGVTPAMPDGAYYQWRHCVNHGTVLGSIREGVDTRGALLFVEDPLAPTTFDTIPHVAISLGDGTTVEARGRAWGVGSFTAAGRFQHAARIPGVDYTPRPTWPADEEDPMRQYVLDVPWQPPNPNGTDPFFVVSEIPGEANAFTVASVNDAPHAPAWRAGQHGEYGPGVTFEDIEFLGLWTRKVTGATGRILVGGIRKADRLSVACEGGGTYQVARR